VVVTSTIASTVLSFCMAYAIARMQWGLKAVALTLIFIGQFHNLPTSLEEAALIDGASWPRILWSVVRPLATPAIITVSVMTFLTNWNEFIMANTFLATDDLRTLPFSIIKFQGEYSADYAAQFACMVMVALPPVLLYLFFAKWIMAGATAGAIKG